MAALSAVATHSEGAKNYENNRDVLLRTANTLALSLRRVLEEAFDKCFWETGKQVVVQFPALEREESILARSLGDAQ